MSAELFQKTSAVPNVKPGFCFAVTGIFISQSSPITASELPASSASLSFEVFPPRVTATPVRMAETDFKSLSYMCALSRVIIYSPALAVSVTVNVSVKNVPASV